MASRNREDYTKSILIPIPNKISTEEEMLEFVHKVNRTRLIMYGEETKILINKNELEKILNNLPENCPICDSKFNENNFYLTDIANDLISKTYVECLCEGAHKSNKNELSIYSKETKILINKNELEKVLKNLPENCPICDSKFNKNNFYLVDIACGCCAETYVECLCENYRDVLVEMR